MEARALRPDANSARAQPDPADLGRDSPHISGFSIATWMLRVVQHLAATIFVGTSEPRLRAERGVSAQPPGLTVVGPEGRRRQMRGMNTAATTSTTHDNPTATLEWNACRLREN
jgi:hypothetical protein